MATQTGKPKKNHMKKHGQNSFGATNSMLHITTRSLLGLFLEEGWLVFLVPHRRTVFIPAPHIPHNYSVILKTPSLPALGSTNTNSSQHCTQGKAAVETCGQKMASPRQAPTVSNTTETALEHAGLETRTTWRIILLKSSMPSNRSSMQVHKHYSQQE